MSVFSNKTRNIQPGEPQSGSSVPVHIAIIMDGNGRWAKQRHLPRTEGHRNGAAAVRRAVKSAISNNVGYLTLFSFSSENWRRPEQEVTTLMGLLKHYLKREIDELDQQGVRIRFIGDRSRLSADIVQLIEKSETRTAQNTVLGLNIALSYGSRDEIVHAARAVAHKVANSEMQPEDIDEAEFESHLFTAGIPDPDLLLRTSGEQRISNFLLWQLAYAELVFLDVFWPDFNDNHMKQAIEEFQKRERRYGALKDD